MGIEYTKDGKMINTCDWPDCGCREEVEWRYDKGWASYTGFDEDLREIYGLPDSGMLCLHKTRWTHMKPAIGSGLSC